MATECVLHTRYLKFLLKSFVSDHKINFLLSKKQLGQNVLVFHSLFKELRSHHKVLVSVLCFCFAVPLAPKEPL